MEGDCSKKMMASFLRSKEEQKGNGLKLHHGKLQLDTKNSLRESVRYQTKFPGDSVEFPLKALTERNTFYFGGDSDVGLLEGRSLAWCEVHKITPK